MQNEMEQFEIFFFNWGCGGDFEFKLRVLCIYMMVEIKIIFTLFMAFASISNATKAHNMIALMLDDYCLNLKCFENICWKGQSYTNDGKI
jgi:hypothetical protein